LPRRDSLRQRSSQKFPIHSEIASSMRSSLAAKLRVEERELEAVGLN
jgi:hypothetical protein